MMSSYQAWGPFSCRPAHVPYSKFGLEYHASPILGDNWVVKPPMCHITSSAWYTTQLSYIHEDNWVVEALLCLTTSWVSNAMQVLYLGTTKLSKHWCTIQVLLGSYGVIIETEEKTNTTTDALFQFIPGRAVEIPVQMACSSVGTRTGHNWYNGHQVWLYCHDALQIYTMSDKLCFGYAEIYIKRCASILWNVNVWIYWSNSYCWYHEFCVRMLYNVNISGPRITNVFATRPKNFSQWHRSFQRKLLSHWLKFLRHVAITLVIQGPGLVTAGWCPVLCILLHHQISCAAPGCATIRKARIFLVCHHEFWIHWSWGTRLMNLWYFILHLIWLLFSPAIWNGPLSRKSYRTALVTELLT